MIPIAGIVLAMQLVTTAFKPNAVVPQRMVASDCGGSNVSPDLAWTNAPKGTKSFALIVHDPDAPHPGGFDHWIFYDVPAAVSHVAAGTQPGTSGVNSTGNAGYSGPCPPPGKAHHYIFTLYALDVASAGGSGPLSAQALKARIARHVLATATLTGLYESR